MSEYHKIQTVYKRDPENKCKTLLLGEYSMPEFEYLANNVWRYTEKVDGTNIRIIFDGETINYGGKTDNSQIPMQLVNPLREKFDPLLSVMREKFPDGCVLYGEGYGAKIQKGGGNYRKDQGFVLFDVNVGGYWLLEKDVIDVSECLDIDIVPVIGEGSLDAMVAMTEIGFKSMWGDFLAEGIVARPKTEFLTRNGQRIITKIKHKDFK